MFMYLCIKRFLQRKSRTKEEKLGGGGGGGTIPQIDKNPYRCICTRDNDMFMIQDSFFFSLTSAVTRFAKMISLCLWELHYCHCGLQTNKDITFFLTCLRSQVSLANSTDRVSQSDKIC